MTMYSTTFSASQFGGSATRLDHICWRAVYGTAEVAWRTIREWRRRSRSRSEVRMLNELERAPLRAFLGIGVSSRG
jgi:uncharacterized protein YjiS (DUF1127 family)